MLRSVIDDGNIFVSTCSDAELNDLQILQNNAIRCIYGISDPRDEHVPDLHLRVDSRY